MLMDPHLNQHHWGIQRTVFQPQKEVTRPRVQCSGWNLRRVRLYAKSKWRRKFGLRKYSISLSLILPVSSVFMCCRNAVDWKHFAFDGSSCVSLLWTTSRQRELWTMAGIRNITNMSWDYSSRRNQHIIYLPFLVQEEIFTKSFPKVIGEKKLTLYI